MADQTPVTTRLDEHLAALVYADNDEAPWLPTIDGSPNSASYDYVDRLFNEGALNLSPLTLATLTVKTHNGTRASEDGSKSCQGCGAVLDCGCDAAWADVAAALHRHQWQMLGLFRMAPSTSPAEGTNHR